MRIIRTEIYLDRADVEWPHGCKPPAVTGIAAAWVKSDARLYPADHGDFGVRTLWKHVEASHLANANQSLLDDFLYELILGGFYDGRARLRRPSSQNRELINDLLAESIVIERSPPEAMPLRAMLSKASAASIGTFLGVAKAWSNPLLMFVTIPAGILVIGSTLGLAKALEEGLHERLGRLIVSKPISSRRRKSQ